MIVNDKKRLEQRLDKDTYRLLELIGSIADEDDLSIYLVGGIVRDILLDRDNEDIDIVVEGDAVEFCQRLVERLGGKMNVYERFGTTKWVLGRFLIDVISARKELYIYPGALPIVSMSDIVDDIYRRDFSINALAVRLNAENFGERIDIIQGKRDIDNQCIRILHPQSFHDDPIRILRAIRFEQRLGFHIETQTAELLVSSLGLLHTVSKDRLLAEFAILQKEKDVIANIVRYWELGVWESLFHISEISAQRIKQIETYYSLIQQIEFINKQSLDVWSGVWIGICINHKDWNERVLSYSKTKSGRQIVQSVLRLEGIKQSFKGISNVLNPCTELHHLFRGIKTEAVLCAGIFLFGFKECVLLEYIETRNQIPTWISGKTLKQLGFCDISLYKTIIEEWECRFISGEIRDEAGGINWVKRFIFSVTSE